MNCGNQTGEGGEFRTEFESTVLSLAVVDRGAAQAASLLVGLNSGEVEEWEAGAGAAAGANVRVRSRECHQKGVKCLAVDCSRGLMITGSYDAKIKVREKDSSKPLG